MCIFTSVIDINDLNKGLQTIYTNKSDCDSILYDFFFFFLSTSIPCDLW